MCRFGGAWVLIGGPGGRGGKWSWSGKAIVEPRELPWLGGGAKDAGSVCVPLDRWTPVGFAFGQVLVTEKNAGLVGYAALLNFTS